jgi:hypothetical protein
MGAVYAGNMPSENQMKNHTMSAYFLRLIVLLAVFVLSACSTVLHTQVQREHEWPAQMPEKTFTLHAIEDDSAQALQLAQLKNMLQEQLQKLGFVAVAEQPHLLIQLRYAEHAQPVYLLDDVFFTPQHRFWGRGPWRGFGMSFGMPYSYPALYSRFDMPRGVYFPHWNGYAGPHFYPGWWLQAPTASKQAPSSFIYAPMFGGGPVYVYRQSAFPEYARFLQVEIIRSQDQKRLFRLMVHSESQIDLASAFGSRILPFMLESGFADFPGVSGTTQHYSLKLD